MKTFGWIGSILLAVSGIPQAYRSLKDKHTDGVTWGLLVCWFLGEVFCLIYIFPKMDFPLMCNFMLNILTLLVMIYYKVFPRR